MTCKCPLSNENAHFYCNKPPATYYISKNTGLIFQKQAPTIQAMKTYADAEYVSGVYQEYASATSLKYETFKRRAELIRKRVGSGRLLDVGCSCGFFLETSLQYGFDAYGIEFSKEAIALAKPEIRKRISCGDVNKWQPDKGDKFDVIVAFDIIEHTQDPLQFLCNLRQMLSNNGWLIVTTPDTGHFLRYLMRSHWPMLQPLQHTYLFSKKALHKALEITGFRHIHIQNADKTLSLDYLMNQLKANNPLLSKIYRTFSLLLPESLRNKAFSVNIGEMLSFSQNSELKS